jgi:hypothetical protein
MKTVTNNCKKKKKGRARGSDLLPITIDFTTESYYKDKECHFIKIRGPLCLIMQPQNT